MSPNTNSNHNHAVMAEAWIPPSTGSSTTLWSTRMTHRGENLKIHQSPHDTDQDKREDATTLPSATHHGDPQVQEVVKGDAAGEEKEKEKEKDLPHKVQARRLLQDTGFDFGLDPGKRRDFLTWDEYFMAVASLSALRSKDPSGTAGGACIVDAQNRILAIGYDGFPSGCSDNVLPWNMEQDDKNVLHTKHWYVVRAEINAMLNKASADLADSRMYVTRFPGSECAKMMIQLQIRQVIYRTDECAGQDDDSVTAARILLTMAGVEMTPYTTARRSPIVLNLQPPKDGVVADGNVEAKTTTPVSDPSAVQAERAKWADLMKREAHGYNFWEDSGEGGKRLDYLSWDEYFMALSFLSALRSKDPQTQVGACIVSAEKRVVGIGYNGFPRDCHDDDLPWGRSAPQALHTKYPYVCHAEVNAICNKSCGELDGCTLYVALFPCHECAKVIVQSRIAQVVYWQDKYHDSDSCRASRILFAMAGIQTRQFGFDRQDIVLRLQSTTTATTMSESDESPE